MIFDQMTRVGLAAGLSSIDRHGERSRSMTQYDLAQLLNPVEIISCFKNEESGVCFVKELRRFSLP